MLVLGRATGERIDVLTRDGVWLGEIVVVESKNGYVRLGLSFAEDILLLRAELKVNGEVLHDAEN